MRYDARDWGLALLIALVFVAGVTFVSYAADPDQGPLSAQIQRALRSANSASGVTGSGDPGVAVDAASISRLLNNLIWNAIEACCKDLRKHRHAVVVRADFYDTRHFMFEVEDDADGMEPRILDNLFNPFFSTKGAAGTGLGLVVVDRIVQSHGGKIEILTKTGKGSLFRTIFSLSTTMDTPLPEFESMDAFNPQKGGKHE